MHPSSWLSKGDKIRGLLRENILEYFPQAQEQSDGKNIVLVFEQGMQQMLKQVKEFDYEGESLLLAKVAKILHRELSNLVILLLLVNKISVPSVLKMFISMLLNGIDLKKTMISLTHKQFLPRLKPFYSTIRQNLQILPSSLDILQTENHHCHCSLA